jgi:reactive intermediate/imine deaminase
MATPVGPYTPIVRADDWLVCSGQVGLADGRLVDGGVASQVTQAIANIAALLEQEGASLTDVVKTTVFLVDIGDYAAMNEIYRTFFPKDPPARSTVAGSGLALGARVEIECIALAAAPPR